MASHNGQRIAIVARLRRGALSRAQELIADGPPFDLRRAGLERHCVFVAPDAVVFVFEGPNVNELVHDVVNHPVVSASFAAWSPLLDGAPHLAHERFFWQR